MQWESETILPVRCSFTSVQWEASLQQTSACRLRNQCASTLRLEAVQSQPLLSTFLVNNAQACPEGLWYALLACPLSCFPTEKRSCKNPSEWCTEQSAHTIRGCQAFSTQRRGGSLLLTDYVGFGVEHGVLNIVPSSCSYEHRNNS